jgi:hypothetical protein
LDVIGWGINSSDNCHPQIRPENDRKRVLVFLAIRYFRIICIAFIAAVMLTMTCVQIPYIKSHLVQHIITRLASSHGVSAVATNIHGALPFSLNVESLQISDSSGHLAQMKDLRIKLAAVMLLRGKIHIENIKLDCFEWLREKKNLPSQVPNQLPDMFATLLPLALNQTVLKQVQINTFKIPAVTLSFHFQKNGTESLIELKTIEKDLVKNKKQVEGIFRLAPKDKGAEATIHFSDLSGVLSGAPVAAEGKIHIADMDMLLPVGSITVHANNQKINLHASTLGGITHLEVNNNDANITCDVNVKQMIEQHTTPIQNINIRKNNHQIQGNGNLAFNEEHIKFDYNVLNNANDVKGTATLLLLTRTLQVKGSGHWGGGTLYSFEGDIHNVGADSRLKRASMTFNGHEIKLLSDKGLSFDEKTDDFTFDVDGHLFAGSAAFNHDGYLMHLKPTTWQWARNNVLALHISSNGARIDGAFDIDCGKMTNGVVQGTGHAALQLNHTMSGTLSCTLPDIVVSEMVLGKTIASIQFDKGNGEINITTGSDDIQHLPHGVAKGRLLLAKKTLHVESLQLAYHQHLIALKAPTSINLDPQKIPNFIIGVDKAGVIQSDAKRKQITFENIPLLATRVFIPSWDMGGLINGKIDITSLYDQWKGYVGLSQLTPYLSSPLTNNALFKDFTWTMHFERQAKQLFIDMHTQRDKTQIFKAKGTISINEAALLQSVINFNVIGELDISLISSLFNTPDRLGGILNMNLTMQGTLVDVALSGHVNARDGLYDSSDNGTYIANIGGTFKAVGKKLIIEKLAGNDVRDVNTTAKDAHMGTLDITGGFEFVGFALPHFALNLNLNDLIVVHRDDMTMRATGDIKINGPGLQSKITGGVTLTPSLILLEEFTDDDISHIEIEELEKQKKKKKIRTEPLFPIELALNVDKNFYIRDLDLGLMSQWVGTVMVKGDLSDPYLEGTLTATKGKFSFFGKPLKIKEAKISYDSDDKNNPNIWLIGIREVDDVTVQLSVSGRAPSFKITFSSDPSLPEDEVLSRLLFGKELSKISAGQSVQLASVGASLNNKKGLNFLENLRSSFGFDTFELKENDMKANLSESGQTASQALRVGKEFENMRVSIDQSIGSSGSKATISTALTKNVYLDLELGEKNAGSGAGLSWVFRY